MSALGETFFLDESLRAVRSWINATGNREYYMSCSCVTIRGSGKGNATMPGGSPLLIANLQANLNVLPSDDTFWSRCNTVEGTSVIYPEKYKGLNAVVRAPIALNLQDFPGQDDPTCGSDNKNTIDALRGNITGKSSYSVD